MRSSDDGFLNIIRGAVIIFSGTIVGQGLGMAGQVLMARWLQPARFGDVALAYTIVTMVGTVATLGTAKGVTQMISGDVSQIQRQRFLFSGYLISMSAGIVLFTSLVLFTPLFVGLFQNPNLGNILPLIALYLIVYPLANVSVGGLRGIEHSKSTVFARNGGKVIGLIVLGGSILIGVELIGAIGYYVATQLFIGLIAVYIIYNNMIEFGGNRWFPTKEDISQMFNYSWPLAISGGFLTLMGNVDILLIGYYLESEQVGIYRAIQPIAMLILMLLTSFVFLFMPTVSKNYKSGKIEKVQDLFTSTSKFVSLITFPLVAVFTLFSEDVIIAFYGTSYRAGALAFAILSIGAYLRVIVGPNGAMIKAIDRTKVDMISAVCGIFVNIILNIVLIPTYGIAGAAVATACGYLVYNTIELFVIYRSVEAHPFSVDIIKPMVLTTIVATIIVFSAEEQFGLLALILVGLLLSITHVSSVLLTNSLDSSDIILFRRIEDRFGITIPFLEVIIDRDSKEK